MDTNQSLIYRLSSFKAYPITELEVTANSCDNFTHNGCDCIHSDIHKSTGSPGASLWFQEFIKNKNQ